MDDLRCVYLSTAFSTISLNGTVGVSDFIGVGPNDREQLIDRKEDWEYSTRFALTNTINSFPKKISHHVTLNKKSVAMSL